MILALTALAVSSPTEPDRWARVGAAAASEYLDTQSVSRTGTKVTAWTRRELPQGATLWHEIELDCAERTQTIIAFIKDDNGAVSHNDLRPHRPAAAVRPGSVEEEIYELLCRSAVGAPPK